MGEEGRKLSVLIARSTRIEEMLLAVQEKGKNVGEHCTNIRAQHIGHNDCRRSLDVEYDTLHDTTKHRLGVILYHRGQA